jgi:NADH-quinone oxidoreductase subunit L
MIAGTVASLAGLALGWVIYKGAKEDPLPSKLGALARGMRDKFYFDEIYAWLNKWTQERLSHYADWFDRWIIAGLGVRGTSGAVDLTGCLLRLVQSGNLQTYALLLALGLLVMLTFFLF